MPRGDAVQTKTILPRTERAGGPSNSCVLLTHEEPERGASMRRASIFIALMTISSMATVAAGAPADIMIKNKIDCGQWIRARSEKTSGGYEWYLIGIVNGMSMGTRVDIWQKDRISNDQFFLWVDKYCRDNPLKLPIEGLIDFAN